MSPESRDAESSLPLEDDSEVYRNHVDPRDMCKPNAYASEVQNRENAVVEG